MLNDIDYDIYYARLGINVLNSLTTKNHCLNYSNNL